MKQIPSPAGLDPEVRKPIEAIKENIEQLRGVRGTKIDTLPSTATLAEVIAKTNEIITRLQG